MKESEGKESLRRHGPLLKSSLSSSSAIWTLSTLDLSFWMARNPAQKLRQLPIMSFVANFHIADDSSGAVESPCVLAFSYPIAGWKGWSPQLSLTLP